MFERFTNRARATVVHAQEEARLLHHTYIGTEHILLGLIRESDGVAAKALTALGVSLTAVREQVLEIVGQGEGAPKGHIPFTPRAKKVLELSLREALQLKHNYIGTEHILLGLIREGEGVAARILVNLGAELNKVRGEVTRQLASGSDQPGPDDAAASPRRTPAAEQAVEAAQRLAGGSPMGSHHLLEALVRSEDSAAARALAALGVDADTLADKIDEIGIDDTSDLTEDEAAARQMEIRLEDEEVRIVLRDRAARELTQTVIGHLGGPIRGDDPVAGGLVGLHQAIVRTLTELQARVAPSPEDDSETETTSRVSAVIQRAIHSRLRRRGR